MENKIYETEQNLRCELKNARGKRMLEKVYLDYVVNLIDMINNDLSLKDALLKHMDIDEKQLILYLSGDTTANITFYDEALSYAMKRIRKNSNPVTKNGI